MARWSKLPPFVFSLLYIFSVCDSQVTPKVKLSFPDAADSDFQNETYAVMTNSNPIFELECEAPYPVEWIIHYSEEDDGTSEKEKRAETHRLVDTFEDVHSYKYLAKIRLEYNGKLLVLANFTCRGTESDTTHLQTHVYMEDQNRKSTLILQVSTEDRGYFLPEDNANLNNCSSAITTVTYEEHVDWTSCWTCETPRPQRKELELDIEFCRSPIQCNSMHSRHNKKKNCLEIIPWAERRNDSYSCKRYGEVPLEFNAKFVVCKNFGPALAQLHFYGIFRGDPDNDTSFGPPIYYDWSEIDPQEMIYMHPIKKDVYLGENITFTCEYSNFYFSLGSWFTISSANGVQYIKGFDWKPCGFGPRQNHNCRQEIVWKGTYYAELPIIFNMTGPHRVYCNGPVWNTTEWVKTSTELDVQQGEHPRVSSVTPDKPDDFIIGQRNRSLRCNFRGKPAPTVEWNGPVNTYKKIDKNTYSEIIFPEIGYQTAGTYTCRIFNFIGSDEKSFKLDSHPETTKLGTLPIIAIVASCLVVLVIVLAVILRMRKIIVQQQEALRLLTEAEIEEFINGNPDIIEKAKNDYFNNAATIDALPYDNKYEIPPDKLSIDYAQILGSGQFGLVLKGKVHRDNAHQYVNIAFAEDTITEISADSNEFVVAIKVCKKDVDVQNFKALLSEIKVMAYLGHHKNIVSLIGASTQNIRNRELYIAVEYCHNGSLEAYVKRNKSRFLNKVKYGYYNDDAGETEGLSYINLNDRGDGDTDYLDSTNMSCEETCVFSSVELFRWTRDIADGVEYIHLKKVIHGDLAIRNILLTKGLSAKVGDFGLSRQLVESASYTKRTQCPLPWRNMALESLKALEFSVKSDMWSLAVTLWELYTLGDLPYGGMVYTPEFVRSIEDGTIRLAKPTFATNNIYEFMLMCWQNNPADRPASAEVKVICEKLLATARSS